MSAQQLETENLIQPWRQGNHFSLTLRGHWSRIPEPTQQIRLENYDPNEVDDIVPIIKQVASENNYNVVYDSFYAPVDFKLRGMSFQMPEELAEDINYDITIRVNQSIIEKAKLLETEDHNQKRYELECDFLIYEDDFIEIEIEFDGEENNLEFNENNIVYSVAGCVWYGMYKEIWATIQADVATTENIELSGLQTIDGIALSTNDIVLVKNQTTKSENGLYIAVKGTWSRHSNFPTFKCLEDEIIYVKYGNTMNSDITHNYTLVDLVETNPNYIPEEKEGQPDLFILVLVDECHFAYTDPTWTATKGASPQEWQPYTFWEDLQELINEEDYYDGKVKILVANPWVVYGPWRITSPDVTTDDIPDFLVLDDLEYGYLIKEESFEDADPDNTIFTGTSEWQALIQRMNEISGGMVPKNLQIFVDRTLVDWYAIEEGVNAIITAFSANNAVETAEIRQFNFWNNTSEANGDGLFTNSVEWEPGSFAPADENDYTIGERWLKWCSQYLKYLSGGLSDDCENFIGDYSDYIVGYPLVSWSEGDKWYKTSILLQNRSGNEEISDRTFLDIVRSPFEFLIQGMSMSIFLDYLKVVDDYRVAEN